MIEVSEIRQYIELCQSEFKELLKEFENYQLVIWADEIAVRKTFPVFFTTLKIAFIKNKNFSTKTWICTDKALAEKLDECSCVDKVILEHSIPQ